jgi:hypothetical protein
MRYYSTKRINGSLRFVCNQCLYETTISSFDPKDGDVRTQAATAVNQPTGANHSASGFTNSGRKLVEYLAW